MKTVWWIAAGLVVATGEAAQQRVRHGSATGRVLRVDDGAAPLSHVRFVTVQAAVDAARDGDVVLIEPGDYPTARVSGKSVSLIADGDEPVILERLEVADLAVEQVVAVRGIRTRSNTVIEDNEGVVWLEGLETQRLTITNTRSCSVTSSLVGTGVRATAVDELFLFESTVLGTHGADGKADAVFLGDCDITPAGNGGHGIVLQDALAFVSGCDVLAGDGGRGDLIFTCCARGGDGGSALVARAGATAQVQDSELVPGVAGGGPCIPGTDGLPIWLDGGEAHELGGTSRRYEIAAVTRIGRDMLFSFAASPGDRPSVFWSERPLARADFALGAPTLLALEHELAFDPLPSGQGDVATAALPIGGLSYGLFFTQALFDVSGGGTPDLVPGPPSIALVVDEPCFGAVVLQDCNANGIDDGCEVATGLSPDADADGVPDECATAFRWASGPVPVIRSVPVEFVLPDVPPASGPVRIRIGASGLGALAPSSAFRLALNGLPLGPYLQGTAATCTVEAGRTLILDPGIFEGIVGAGDAVFTVTPPSFTTCAQAVVTLDVAYPRAEVDANGNFVDDLYDLGPLTDCDGNGELDRSELERRASGSTVPFNVYFPIDVSIPAPARSAGDVVVHLDVTLDSQTVFLYVNETAIGSFYTPSCPGRAQHDFVIARRRWNAIVGSGPARVYALAAEPSSSCADGGALSVRWTDAALDCNGNGRLDSCDVASGRSSDVNENGIPDECE